MSLTHLDEHHHPVMVDVSHKLPNAREAIASGEIWMSREAYDAILTYSAPKGSVIDTVILAAIMGGKRCSDLIPLCHPLPLTSLSCDIEPLEHTIGFRLRTRAKTTASTGVEMEALTAVSVGLLTFYDMLKALDPAMSLHHIALETKTGGSHGPYHRS